MIIDLAATMGDVFAAMSGKYLIIREIVAATTSPFALIPKPKVIARTPLVYKIVLLGDEGVGCSSMIHVLHGIFKPGAKDPLKGVSHVKAKFVLPDDPTITVNLELVSFVDNSDFDP